MADIGDPIRRRRVVPLEAEPKADPAEPKPAKLPEPTPKKEPANV